MALKYNLSVFAKELLLFAMALVLGLLTALRHNAATQGVAQTILEPIDFNSSDIIVLVLFFAIFTFLIVRFRRVATIVLRLFFVLVIFAGAQIVSESFFSFVPALILSCLVSVSMIGGASVLMHNLGVILGIAGLSAVLGLSLPPTTSGLLLAALSVYDIIAVYKTKHMVALAENMVASHAIFGLLIPFRWEGFFGSSLGVRPGQQVMILGSGDVGLPIVFAASLVPVSLTAALFVGGFSIVGLFVTHLLFSNQATRRPMAALPPIASASLLGYLVYLLIF